MHLSVIVPTLDEEGNLATLLPALEEERRRAALATAGELEAEVVISDGGSVDRTRELATQAGCRVIEGDPGRGPQLNRGAEAALAAGSDVLLFLHADTRLPAGAFFAVTEALTTGACQFGGAFEVCFDDPARIFRLGDRIVAWRTRLTGVPLGDQAHFVTAVAFRRLGGYADWPILEDLDFMRRLKTLERPTILPGPVVTAARRYRRRGIARTIVRNWLIWGLYFVGVSPHRLARLYRPDR